MSLALFQEPQLTGAHPSPNDAVASVPMFRSSRFLAGVGTSFDIGPDIDLFPFHRPRRQKRNNCVAHARCNVIQVLMAVRAGGDLGKAPLLSVDYAYALGQLLWQPPPAGGLFPDSGSHCVLVAKALWDHGIVTEESYPEEDVNGLRIPPDDVWQKGAAAKVVGMHRLDEGADAPAQLYAALAIALQGGAAPPNIVTTADEAMGAVAEDGLLDAPGGAVWGGHDQAVLSYRRDLCAGGAFGIGDQWGRVRYYMSASYVAKNGREMLVTEAAPAAPVS